MNRNDRITFFRESIANIRDTGSFVPSSLFLAERLAAPIERTAALKIVELGAGTGSVTKYLLKILPPDAKLIAVEMNPILCKRLRVSIRDPRCIIAEGDAQELDTILKSQAVEMADYVISGIPLANLNKVERNNIFSQIRKCLKPDGAYTQFQYFMSNFREIKQNFKISHLAFEWRNLPPAFVYTCKLL